MLPELSGLWEKIETRQQVMFSHAAAGPLTALQMLEIAEAHLETHRRQIDRISSEFPVR
jgi:hypothetical protein